MTTYNYVCIQDDCSVSGNIPVKKEDEFEDREEYCYECDKPMKCLGQMTNFVIQGDIQTRMLRNQAHFTKRAKVHANTDEQKHLKQTRQDQEFANMGVVKKNTL
jgi:hypothetical protein